MYKEKLKFENKKLKIIIGAIFLILIIIFFILSKLLIKSPKEELQTNKFDENARIIDTGDISYNSTCAKEKIPEAEDSYVKYTMYDNGMLIISGTGAISINDCNNEKQNSTNILENIYNKINPKWEDILTSSEYEIINKYKFDWKKYLFYYYIHQFPYDEIMNMWDEKISFPIENDIDFWTYALDDASKEDIRILIGAINKIEKNSIFVKNVVIKDGITYIPTIFKYCVLDNLVLPNNTKFVVDSSFFSELYLKNDFIIPDSLSSRNPNFLVLPYTNFVEIKKKINNNYTITLYGSARFSNDSKINELSIIFSEYTSRKRKIYVPESVNVMLLSTLNDDYIKRTNIYFYGKKHPVKTINQYG